MKKIGIFLFFLLCHCKTTRQVNLPSAPSILSFSGYTQQRATTYCDQSTTPATCIMTPEEEKFSKDCKEAQRCRLGHACEPGGLMLVTCKNCTYLCSEDPYSVLFKRPTAAP